MDVEWNQLYDEWLKIWNLRVANVFSSNGIFPLFFHSFSFYKSDFLPYVKLNDQDFRLRTFINHFPSMFDFATSLNYDLTGNVSVTPSAEPLCRGFCAHLLPPGHSSFFSPHSSSSAAPWPPPPPLERCTPFSSSPSPPPSPSCELLSPGLHALFAWPPSFFPALKDGGNNGEIGVGGGGRGGRNSIKKVLRESTEDRKQTSHQQQSIAAIWHNAKWNRATESCRKIMKIIFQYPPSVIQR